MRDFVGIPQGQCPLFYLAGKPKLNFYQPKITPSSSRL